MIYLDNASTNIVKKEVLDYFSKMVRDYPGNTSSMHRIGYLANKKMQQTREEILEILDLDKKEYEVIFNSSSTEGINHALKGYALKNISRGSEIIAFKNEHPAVLKSLEYLQNKNFKILYVNCDENGEIDYEDLQKKMSNQTIMVVVMSVNNENGAINDLKKIHNIVSEYNKCIFFSDVTQSIGKIKIDYNNIDMFTFSAHKFGGLIGSGVLIKKKKILLNKLIDGGEQENNYRGGTNSLPLAETTKYSLYLAEKNLEKNFEKVNRLKNILIKELSLIKEIEINSFNNFPYIINFSLKNKKASIVIEALSKKEIYVSSLSACSEKTNRISYVLSNMKKSKQIAENSIRVSFSSENTEEEVITFINELRNILMVIR